MRAFDVPASPSIHTWASVPYDARALRRRRHASALMAINLIVEIVALLFVVGATVRIPWYWHLARVTRPTTFVWSDQTWTRHVRAFVPSVAAGWAFVVVFPAAWYSDHSTVAAAIVVGGGVFICAAPRSQRWRR
jgi:hypothetical protein